MDPTSPIPRSIACTIAGGLALSLAVSDAPASAATSATAAPSAKTALYDLIRDLQSPDTKTRRKAAKKVRSLNDPRALFPLVDSLFFTDRENRTETLATLEALFEVQLGPRYLDWVEYSSGRTDLEIPPGYLAWKSGLLARIDPRYPQILRQGDRSLIRIEEIVWGGVRFDGIPALEDPHRVAASEVDFLADSDRVFGVSLGGAHHAYPVKVLSWHEMVNDTVGGVPITLSYCTLCGSGILYSTRREDGGADRFGTSGLLYRSNKLMFDRETQTLWSNLTGEAVLGPRAETGEQLEMLPVTLTRWQEWRSRHPDTTVQRPDPALGARYNFSYEEGAADRARSGVSFPVYLKSDRLPPQTEVLALRVGDRSKAYVVEAVLEAGVVNDQIGDVPLVVLGDSSGGGVRAYRRGSHTFRIEDGSLVDGNGTAWTATEDRLEPAAGSELEALPRVASHVAFWFGWYGFYPDTEVYP